MPPPSRLLPLLAILAAEGGVADHATLAAATSPAVVRRAVERGALARVGTGLFARPDIAARAGTPPTWGWVRDGGETPTVEEALVHAAAVAVARAHHAVLARRCAAALHGWPVLVPPPQLELLVPPSRRRFARPGLRVDRAPLSEEERREHVTSPVRTVLECAATLPLAEGVAIADAALRTGRVGMESLRVAADTWAGPNPSLVRRVAHVADPGAANPFESALRVLLLDVEGLHLRTQVPIPGMWAHADLADEELRIVVEADGHEFHGSAEAFVRDLERHDGFVARGWLSLRFGVEHVLRRPEWVLEHARAVVQARRAGRARAI